MSSVPPKLKAGKSLQIQLKQPNQKCTINSLTSTLKRLIPNIKEIKITSKKLPRDVNKKYMEQVLRSSSARKGQKTQMQVKKSNAKDKLQATSEVEYYPDKLKRKIDFKRIVLQPRHDYKVVAATNKRKRSTPMKDAGCLKKLKTDITPPEISTNELSFEDMIPSSIIHKINDFKNTSLHNINRPETASDIKNTQKTTKKGPTTDSDIKNTQKTTKKGLRTASDNKNTQKTTKKGLTTSSDLKSDSKTPSDLKFASQKVNRRQKCNLKCDSNVKTPQKVLNSDSSASIEKMEELMNGESLTDEDFMEILTCPSPVWWEDPPDANYIEEPIGRFLNQENLSKTTQPKGITQNSHPEANVATNSFGSKELIEKRLKLENLLSTLKYNCTNKTEKINDKVRKISSDGSELSVDENELVKSLQSIEIPIENVPTKNINKENEILSEKIDDKPDSDELEDVNKISVAKVEVTKSNNHEITIKNEISIDKTVNNLNNDETCIKNAVDDNDDPKVDNKSSIENNTVINSPIVENKAISPRKSNRISPKKHQLTKYYNLKSKRPRIIKQNSRNKIIIENHIKTNINLQKTPEKKLDRKPNNVSKIKKAYLDLLKNSKIENNLASKQENKEIKENANKTENIIKMETDNDQPKITETTKQNNNTEAENIKSETVSNNNNKNTKSINEIPLILPKLTKNPQNVTIESPKSIKSVTSDSTEVNSEMDTISDTNVQFIDEYDEKKDELVAVYQIIGKNETNI